MLLCGLWHGAAWTFIAWGFYHGLFIVLERLALKKCLQAPLAAAAGRLRPAGRRLRLGAVPRRSIFPRPPPSGASMLGLGRRRRPRSSRRPVHGRPADFCRRRRAHRRRSRPSRLAGMVAHAGAAARGESWLRQGWRLLEPPCSCSSCSLACAMLLAMPPHTTPSFTPGFEDAAKHGSTKREERPGPKAAAPFRAAARPVPGVPAAHLDLPLLDTAFRVSRPVFFRENRKPAPLPRFELRRPLAFPGQYEAYFNDHFGLRTQMLRAHGRLVLNWFHTSPTPKVIVGRQGWLFLARGSRDPTTRSIITATSGRSPRQELEAFKNILEERRDWLAAAASITCSCRLPARARSTPSSCPGPSTRPMPGRAWTSSSSTCPVIPVPRLLDLRPALLREKQRARIYHKTDTHWNDLGGYFAYREMIGRLREYFPEAAAHAPGRLHRQPGLHPRRRPGHHALPAARPLPRAARRCQAQGPVPRPHGGSDPGVQAQGPWVRVHASECPGGEIPAAVMVHDSFAQQLHPYLSEHFRRIVYIWDWKLRFYIPRDREGKAMDRHRRDGRALAAEPGPGQPPGIEAAARRAAPELNPR